jgi:putative transposase
VACRVLNVSRSDYYDWLGRPASLPDQENEYLLKQITRVHTDSQETYGSPRVHAELTLGLGLQVNLKRVARPMRDASIQSLHRPRRRGRTVRDPTTEPSNDPAQRQFTLKGPTRSCVTEITEHPTMDGTVYRTAVMDTYSRLTVDRPTAEHRSTELITDAPDMTIIRRQPNKKPGNKPTILHSDHATQYTSWASRQRLRTAEPLASIGTVNDCYDNSIMKPF